MLYDYQLWQFKFGTMIQTFLPHLTIFIYDYLHVSSMNQIYTKKDQGK